MKVKSDYCRFCKRETKKGEYRYWKRPIPTEKDRKQGCLCWECKGLIVSLLMNFGFEDHNDFKSKV